MEQTLIERCEEAFEKKVGGTSMLPASDLLSLMTRIEQLQHDLAEREAGIARLRGYLHKLACLGNGDIYGNSVGNCLAQEALSTPPSTSYLEQWEKDRYQVVAKVDKDDDNQWADILDDVSVKVSQPLYARKD